MDETRRKLLDRGVLILPDIIGHAEYELLVEAMVIERPDEEIRLFCRGDGGGIRSLMAMMDVIEQHGNVVGILHGAAFSSHAMIWAACQERYVSPRGCIGVHKVLGTEYGHIDSNYARHIAAEFERTEQLGADLLAKISGKPAAYWYDMMQDAGSSGSKVTDAKRLIELGMARPIEELTNGDGAGKDRSGVGVGTQNGATRERA